MQEFRTNDIALASFLVTQGYDVQRTEMTDENHYAKCTYCFVDVPQDLLGAWLAGTAMANAKQLIQSYRHVLRDSRIEIERYKNDYAKAS